MSCEGELGRDGETRDQRTRNVEKEEDLPCKDTTQSDTLHCASPVCSTEKESEETAGCVMGEDIGISPPADINNQQKEELEREKGVEEEAAVVYSPDVPHTEEIIVNVGHCTASIMDIELCYQCFGERKENTPVVLLVGGLNMQLYAWDEAFCEGLARAGFYVIRYDNRDIGKSTKIESRGNVIGYRLMLPSNVASIFGERLPYTIMDMALDGLALLSKLGITQAHVMGISMGGMIAQCMAIAAPTRVISLTSIMSSTSAPDLPDTQLKVKKLLLRKPPKNCTLNELLEFRIKSLREVLLRSLTVDSRYLKKRYLISLRRSSYTDGLVRQAAAIRRCPGRDELLRQLTLPALIIHGTQDLIVPPAHGLRTAQVLQHSRLLVFKHMGHYFHPAFYQPIIYAFSAMAATTPFPGFSPSQNLCPSFLSHGASAQEVEKEEEEAVFNISSPTEPVSPTAAVSGSPTHSSPAGSAGTDAHQATLRHSALQPLVVSPASPCGQAVLKSVNTGVPIAQSSQTPEVAILDLHTAPSSTQLSPSPPSPSKKSETCRFDTNDEAGETQRQGEESKTPVAGEAAEGGASPPHHRHPSSATLAQITSAMEKSVQKLWKRARGGEADSTLRFSSDGGVTHFDAAAASCWNSATSPTSASLEGGAVRSPLTSSVDTRREAMMTASSATGTSAGVTPASADRSPSNTPEANGSVLALVQNVFRGLF